MHFVFGGNANVEGFEHPQNIRTLEDNERGRRRTMLLCYPTLILESFSNGENISVMSIKPHSKI